MAGARWTEEEIRSLVDQIVTGKKTLPQFCVPGKSRAAINNQRRRLKQAGLLDGAFVGRRLRPWTIGELRKLTTLTGEYGFSAAFIAGLQLIPGRSEYAVSKMMGRHGLGNPSVKARAVAAVRLSAGRREALKRFLLGEGRFVPSRQVAEQWGVAQKTVNAYRRRMGIQLSWQQARCSEEYRRSQQQRARDFIEQTRERWRLWRKEREETFERLKQELQAYPCPPPERICAVCGKQWFATSKFFQVQIRHMGDSVKVTMSRTCRLCRSVQRRRGNLPRAGQKLAA